MSLAVVHGSFADFKIIRSRGFAQLIVEIPIERAQAAIAAFGIPQPGVEIPVAIALLVKAPEPVKAPDIAKSERGKDAYRSKDAMEQAVTRASLLCKDMKFQQWMRERRGVSIFPRGCMGLEREGLVSIWLRESLAVKSRNEIALDERAYKAFLAMEMEFKQSVGLVAEARG